MDDGREERLFPLVTSVNIACGGHAGDAVTMAAAVNLAQQLKLSIGAHPSFPDREGFGREVLELNSDDLIDSLTTQIQNLRTICALKKAPLTHVKAHGALYNVAAVRPEVGSALIAAILEFPERFTVVGPAGSPFLKWCVDAGLDVLAEGFTDRRYEADGSLRSRQLDGALIVDPVECGAQAVRLAREGRVQTLCVHGDAPQAQAVAAAVRAALENAGFTLKSYFSAREK